MPPKRRGQPPPSESESEDDGSDMEMPEGAFDGSDFDPNFHTKFLAKLPPAVRERVSVLQAQDKRLLALSEEHDQAVLALRRKYAALAKPLLAKRLELITGTREPTEEEVLAGYPEDHKGQVSLTEGEKTDSKGIPSFWSQVLHHHVIIDEMISEKDDGALEKLIDISVDLLPEGSLGFTINFHFEDNEFFSNTVLSKTFFLKEQGDEYVLDKASGTDIQWKQGKNLGVNITSKKQKNKKGQVRYVTKEEPCPTFFDFFKNGLSEEEEEQNHAMAETLKDKIVPHAIDYFTGEAPNGDSDLENDDEEEENDEEEEEEEEEPEEAHHVHRGRGRGRGAAPHAHGRGGAPPPDCKQQ